MAEDRLKENQFDKQGVNPFNAPIPGESLTTSPDMKKAWERPPQYTDVDNCMEDVYLEITSEESLPELVNLINDGTPLDELAQVILYKGYTQGLWNPDLMLMLIEPTIYLLIAIADYADIKDYVLYEGEEDDPDTDIGEDDITPENMADVSDEEEEPRIEKPSKDVINPSLLAKIETELPQKLNKETE